jgi:hypothetical protein
MGLLNIFPEIDSSNSWNLLTFIVGVWMPSPRLKATAEEKMRQSNSHEDTSAHTSIYNSEEEGEEMDVIEEKNSD